MKTWKLQDAKNKFSELFERALKEGPQFVSRRGKDSVVVLRMDEYSSLKKPKGSIVDFFSKSPLKGSEINLDRIQDFGRKVKL